MRRSICAVLAVIGVAFASLVFTANVLAANPLGEACTGSGANSSYCKDVKNTNDPLTGSGGILSKVAQILLMVVGVVSVAFLILGGIKYILANGDSSQLSSAKNTIIYALIGLVVAVLAESIIAFVLNKL